MNPYTVLGVTENANEAEIKNAFRKLAKKFHPDKNNDPKAKSIFQEILTAYEVLKDNNYSTIVSFNKKDVYDLEKAIKTYRDLKNEGFFEKNNYSDFVQGNSFWNTLRKKPK